MITVMTKLAMQVTTRLETQVWLFSNSNTDYIRKIICHTKTEFSRMPTGSFASHNALHDFGSVGHKVIMLP